VEEARERSQKRPRKIGERSLKKKKKKGGGGWWGERRKVGGKKKPISQQFYSISKSPLDCKTCLNRTRLKTLGQCPFITYLT
jgi:hypothetical protein